ncbi:MAG TPA: hypothetical protein VIM61_00925 [Chthoniobacterales bacterium]
MKFLLALAIAAFALPLRAADTPAQILAGWTPAEILRLMPSDTPPNQRLAGLAFVAGYEVIGQSVSIPAEKSAALLAALTDPAAFTAEKNEEHMRPGVAIRFRPTGPTDKTAILYLLVCFSCDKVALIPPGAGAITATYQIAQPTRDALLGLSKELLPQDEAIQALPKIRSKSAIPPPAAPIPADAPRAGQSSEN